MLSFFQNRFRLVAGLTALVTTALTLALVPVQAQEMQTIGLNEFIEGSVDIGDTSRVYTFTSSRDQATILMLESRIKEWGVLFELQDLNSGEMVALQNQPVTGICVRLQPQQANYLLRIKPYTNTDVSTQHFTMMLTTGDPSVMNCTSGMGNMSGNGMTATGVTGLLGENILDDTITVIDNPGDSDPRLGFDDQRTCQVNPVGDYFINVRALPTLNAGVIASLTGEVQADVVGVVPNTAWLQVNLGGTVGWVATSLVQSLGNCTSIPVLNLSADGELVSLGDLTLDISLAIGDLDLAAAAGIDLNILGTDTLGVDANVNIGGGSGVNVNAGVNLGDGTNLGIDAGIGGGDGGINVDIGGGDGGTDGGINIDIGGGDGDSGGGINVDIGGSDGGGNNSDPIIEIDTNLPVLPKIKIGLG